MNPNALFYLVEVSHLSDAQLTFYGWHKVSGNATFGKYWSARYNETQVVQNNPPRFLVVDDFNDAQQMSNGTVIAGPSGPKGP